LVSCRGGERRKKKKRVQVIQNAGAGTLLIPEEFGLKKKRKITRGKKVS